MKKIILFAILMIGCVAFANAQCTTEEPQTALEEQIVAVADVYNEVALTELSDVIQETVKNLADETFDVMKVEFNTEAELTKVTFVNKEDANEKYVTLDKEGKEVTSEEVIMSDAEVATTDEVTMSEAAEVVTEDAEVATTDEVTMSEAAEVVTTDEVTTSEAAEVVTEAAEAAEVTTTDEATTEAAEVTTTDEAEVVTEAEVTTSDEPGEE